MAKVLLWTQETDKLPSSGYKEQRYCMSGIKYPDESYSIADQRGVTLTFRHCWWKTTGLRWSRSENYIIGLYNYNACLNGIIK